MKQEETHKGARSSLKPLRNSWLRFTYLVTARRRFQFQMIINVPTTRTDVLFYISHHATSQDDKDIQTSKFHVIIIIDLRLFANIRILLIQDKQNNFTNL